jgi:hypothetical protein
MPLTQAEYDAIRVPLDAALAPAPPVIVQPPPVISPPGVQPISGAQLDLGACGESVLAGAIPPWEALTKRKAKRFLCSMSNRDLLDMMDEGQVVGTKFAAFNSKGSDPKNMIVRVFLNTNEWTVNGVLIHTLAETAAGRLDPAYKQQALDLVRLNFADATISLGHEANGGWYAHAAASDPAGYKAAFKRAAAIFRATPGSNFKILHCPANLRQQVAASLIEPDAADFDVYSVDVYNDNYANKGAPRDQQWLNVIYGGVEGLKYHEDRAVALGKPMIIPECATGYKFKVSGASTGTTQTGWPILPNPRTTDDGGGDDVWFWRGLLGRAKARPDLYLSVIPWQRGAIIDKLGLPRFNFDGWLGGPPEGGAMRLPLATAEFLAQIA